MEIFTLSVLSSLNLANLFFSISKYISKMSLFHIDKTSSIFHTLLVHRMCQKIRLDRFQDTCERLRSKYNFTKVDDFNEDDVQKLVGTIDNAHKFIMEVFPKTGSSSWNVIIYNNTRGAHIKPSPNMDFHGYALTIIYILEIFDFINYTAMTIPASYSANKEKNKIYHM